MNPRRPHPSQRRRPDARTVRRPAVPLPSPPSEPVHVSQHRRADPSRHVASLVGITVLAVGVLLTFVYVRMHRQGSAQATAPVAVGGCVAKPAGDLLHAVDCTDPGAFARVTAAVGARAGADCPADTDAVAAGTGRMLCLVNLGRPHPGAPGQGGGVIRAGDCVDNPGTGRIEELVCGDGGYYAKVQARVDHASQCRPPAAEVLSLQRVSHAVVCLQPRARVGTCLGGTTVGPPDPVACTDPKAIGRILARAVNGGACPIGTTARVTAPYGLPGMKVICLAR